MQLQTMSEVHNASNGTLKEKINYYIQKYILSKALIRELNQFVLCLLNYL